MNTEKLITSFGGKIHKLVHESKAVGTTMRLNVFLPPKPEKAPVLVYLSGLTCTGDNALEKGAFLGYLAQHNIAMVFPDTSPRTPADASIAGEHDSWDFGSGAGFYINATQEPWSKNYRMESYVIDELLKELLPEQFPQLDWSRKSISGHSMGGHGALTFFLKYPGEFKSVSAFSPITHPTVVPWGTKAFTNYLGSVEAGKSSDTVELVKKLKDALPKTEVLVDVGKADQFWDQLRVNDLKEATEGTPMEVNLRVHEGYDHSYFFVSTFAGDHVAHHAKALL